MLRPKLKTIMILTLVILAGFMVPTLAATYDPGVSTGQWVKYGSLEAGGPLMPANYNQTDWMKIEVTSVSGKNVTLHMTGKYQNGTEGTPIDLKVNVETGWMNTSYSIYGFFYLIAGNLTQGDTLPVSSLYPDRINKTETRTYMGVSRSVNIVNLTYSVPGYLDYSYVTIYDKASGMLLEMSMTSTSTILPSVSYHMNFKATESNIFGTTGTDNWLQDNMLYIAAAIIIIIILIAAIILMRKKKPPTTETAETTETTTTETQ